MVKKYQFTLIVIFGILILAANIFLNQSKNNLTENVKANITTCRVDLAPCNITSGSQTYEVVIKGEVKPLKKFSVELLDTSNLLDSAVIEFRMKDMDMGKNVFSFNKISTGHWKSSVIIPICTVGRRDWELELVLSSEDKVQKFIMTIEI